MASLAPGHTPILTTDFVFNLKRLLSFQNLHGFHDARDLGTNILLYIPLGAFLSLAVSWPQPRFLTFWLPVGFLVSVVVETVQSTFQRYPDSMDVITNTTGFLFGFWAIVGAVRFFGFRPSVFIGLHMSERIDSKIKAIAAVRFLYICSYFFVSLLPLDISVSFPAIYKKLLADAEGNIRIIFDPFYHFYFWPQDSVKLLMLLLGLVPLGFLTAFLDNLRKHLNIFSPVYVCVLWALVSEIAKIFILSRTSDIIMFLLAIIAGLLGWGTVKLWWRLQEPEQKFAVQLQVYRQKMIALVLLAYIFLLFLILGTPFKFEDNSREILHKLRHEVNFIPFREHFFHRSLDAAMDLVSKTAIWMPLGILLTLLFRFQWAQGKRWQWIWACGLLSAMSAAGLEIFLAAGVGRSLDITDVILALLGGGLGSVLFRLFAIDFLSIKQNVKSPTPH